MTIPVLSNGYAFGSCGFGGVPKHTCVPGQTGLFIPPSSMLALRVADVSSRHADR